ncbi:MAG: hypothetical protein O2820_03705 [Planctomycetota bacterium]|nr:hypothetical protein [Planctomycetota bacterium]MDA1248308.1 hypothetical protein [Planctomycetota bacterium]
MFKSGFVTVVLVMLSGCGSESTSVPTAPVSGKVTLNGKPLQGAIVSFGRPDFVGTGKTTADGSYSLATGAAIGENKIWIKKFVAPEGFNNNPEEGMDQGQLEAMAIDAPTGSKPIDLGEQIPADYSDPVKTILIMVVGEGGTDSANFDITTTK